MFFCDRCCLWFCCTLSRFVSIFYGVLPSFGFVFSRSNVLFCLALFVLFRFFLFCDVLLWSNSFLVLLWYFALLCFVLFVPCLVSSCLVSFSLSSSFLFSRCFAWMIFVAGFVLLCHALLCFFLLERFASLCFASPRLALSCPSCLVLLSCTQPILCYVLILTLLLSPERLKALQPPQPWWIM